MGRISRSVENFLKFIDYNKHSKTTKWRIHNPYYNSQQDEVTNLSTLVNEYHFVKLLLIKIEYTFLWKTFFLYCN